MAQVVELKNPRALLAPEVEKLLRKASVSAAFVAPAGFDAIASDLFELVTNDNSFILMGFEEGEAKSLVWGFFPYNKLFPYPTVQMFYSEGSKELLALTRDKLLEVLLARGYTTAWAVNVTGKSDRAWMKVFETPGKTKIKILGSVMELSVL